MIKTKSPPLRFAPGAHCGSVAGETVHAGQKQARVVSTTGQGHTENLGHWGQERVYRAAFLSSASALCSWAGIGGHTHTHRSDKSQKACPGERPVRDRDSVRSDRDGLKCILRDSKQSIVCCPSCNRIDTDFSNFISFTEIRGTIYLHNTHTSSGHHLADILNSENRQLLLSVNSDHTVAQAVH